MIKWISSEVLESSVKNLIEKAQEAKQSAINDFGKNVIDPFSALFELSGFDMSFDEWIKNETARQAQKTLQNHIGDFHQIVLGSVKGWSNLGVGNVVDLVSDEHKIIAEVKNKYNTISGGKLSDLYKNLENLVMPKSSKYKGYTAYYVPIIPKKPARYDRLFTPSEKESGSRCQENDKIREIDGASFYSLVTGSTTALEDLFNYLPEVIKMISGRSVSEVDFQKMRNYFKKAFD